MNHPEQQHEHHQTSAAAAANPAVQAPVELIVKKETAFHFKKDELGNKRPSVTIALPYLTLAGVAAIINSGDEKQHDLLLGALEDIIYVQAREQVNADANITSDTLDYSKLSWDFISKIPKAERRGAGIPKEIWEAFAADYLSIMPGLIGRDVEKVTNAATILTKRFQPVKTVKKVIAQLSDYLDVWFANTANADDLAEVYEFLKKKAEELLAADEAKLLENI